MGANGIFGANREIFVMNRDESPKFVPWSRRLQ